MVPHTRSASGREKPGKLLPAYERPLSKTGEARLWRTLSGGDRVKLVVEGDHSSSGTVDVHMDDRSTVWVFLDHGMGRIAISEGDEVALVPLLP